MAVRSELPIVPDEPLWFEGMLLAPQHLQQQALRHDRALAWRLAALDPHAFGVLDLALDEPALASGLVRIRELTAVMPDGLIVRVPQQDRRPLELDLTGHADRLRVEPRHVLLAVPADEAGPAADRWRSVEGEESLDLTSGQGTVRVPRRLPNLSLRLEERSPGRFRTLPLMEVALRDESYQRTGYTPPLLTLSAREPLALEVARVVRRMREKAVYLSERRRAEAGGYGHGGGDALAASALPVLALTHGLAELEALLGLEGVRPLALHLALCRAAGALTALAGFGVPPQFRAWRHEDPAGSMQPVLRWLSSCLDQIRQDFTIVQFDQTEYGFALDLARHRPERELICAAQVQPGVNLERSWDWVERSLMAAAERIEQLMARRILGADRQLLPADVAARFSGAPDMIVFRLLLADHHVGPEDVLWVVNPSPSQAEYRPANLFAYLPGTEGRG